MINECTIVAGELDGGLFLFKNGDNPTMWDHEIFHTIIDGIEVAYYSNQNGWCEGMTELGISMVFAYLTDNLNLTDKYQPKGKSTLPSTEEIDLEYLSHKGKDFLDILLSRSLDEMINKIQKYEWNGNYFITDSMTTYEIEYFQGEMKYKELYFNKNFTHAVKTNHGIMLPNAGQINVPKNIRRGDSEIRRYSAMKYLMGYKDFKDVIKRMGFQEFDPDSSLNVFRTDEWEKTTSQILADVDNLILYFIFHEDNSKFYGIVNKLPEDYEPKIQIKILDRDKFYTDEYCKFKEILNYF